MNWPRCAASCFDTPVCCYERFSDVCELPVLSCQQIRQIDRIAIDELQMPGLVLMENAGRGVVELMLRQGIVGSVVIACGPGNNGGDGFVIARHLDLLGLEVHVVLACDPQRLRGDAKANFGWLAQTNVRLYHVDGPWPPPLADVVERSDWIVDALLGTGVQGPPRPPVDQVIGRLNQVAARRLAVDIPSGLDGESGSASATTFCAQLTATFVAAKPGLMAPAAAAYVGRLEIVDIGVPRKILERFGLMQSRPDTHS
jgi:NAD(P)H-hydrate epimerase